LCLDLLLGPLGALSHKHHYPLSSPFSVLINRSTSIVRPRRRAPLQKTPNRRLLEDFEPFYGTPKIHYYVHKSPPLVGILNHSGLYTSINVNVIPLLTHSSSLYANL
jgi:hypothetical protein